MRRFHTNRMLLWLIMPVLFLTLIITLFQFREENNHMTQQQPTPNAVPPVMLGAWIYPDKLGSPACSAPQEYSDGRKIDVIKPEYFRLEDSGSLTQITADQLCNGYSAANAADIKAHSKQQFVTISGGITGIVSLATHLSLYNTFVSTLTSFLSTTGFTGVELDIEGYGAWTTEQYTNYKSVITMLGNALHAANRRLMIDGPIIFNQQYQNYYKWKWEDFEALPVDYLVSMCYDLQYDNGAGTPVSSLQNIRDCCSWVKARISDHNRIVVGIPNYAYSGTLGQYQVKKATYQEAKNYPGFSTATRDTASGEMIWTVENTAYDYSDSTTLNMKVQAILAEGISNISIWSLGGGGAWPTQLSDIPPAPQPTQDQLLAAFTARYPGFDQWYQNHFDEEGHYLG